VSLFCLKFPVRVCTTCLVASYEAHGILNFIYRISEGPLCTVASTKTRKGGVSLRVTLLSVCDHFYTQYILLSVCDSAVSV
jgi:hypothetical protein